MTTYATESSVQMSGAGLVGRDTASVGMSKRITIGAGLTLSGGELVCTLNPAGYLTIASAAATYQPLNANLTTISGLSPSNDDFLQRKAGAWANRTIAQVKADLGLSGTNTGDQDLSAYATIAGSVASFVSLTGSYSNPSWITGLAWSKISSTPTTLAGYGISDAYPLSGNPAGYLVSADLSSYLTSAAAAAAYQPLNTNLTTISGLSPSNDDFLQRKAGAWANRTIAQVKADLGLTGTNSGDQTISLTGDVTGSGTGSFAATIANSAVTLAKMADVATASVFYRKTAGTGAPEVQTLATLKTDLGLTGTNSGDQTISLTGDVTGSGTGSFAVTIANSAVTLAKLADVATDTVFYRKTAGTGAPEVQTLATLKTDLGLTGTNSGDQTITLFGDVTGSGTTSFGTTIANSAVTLAKLADVATGTVFYRTTAGTGAPEVQTLATLKTDLGLTGTNSGDQTTIVGITGTKAQFDTACSDGNFLYVGDAPTSHAHGNITNAGAIGSTSGLPIITTTSGVLTTGAFGTTAGTFAAGDDSRITGALSSSTAATTYVPLTRTLNSVDLSVDRTLSLGTSGSDANWSGLTLNLPDASASARGLVTTSSQSFSGVKRFRDDIEVGVVNTGTGRIDMYGSSSDGCRIALNEGAAERCVLASGNNVTSLTGGATTGVYSTSGLVQVTLIESVSGALASRGDSYEIIHRSGTSPIEVSIAANYVSSTDFERLKFSPDDSTSGCRVGYQFGSSTAYAVRPVDFGHWLPAGTWVSRCSIGPSSTDFTSDTNMIVRMYAHGDINNGGILQSYKARGTDRNSKLYPVTSDQLIGFNCYGWDENASNWSGAKATWNISVPSTWTATNNGTQHTWTTTDPTDATKTLQNRMRLHGNGNLTVGTITDASTRLHVLSTSTQLRLAYDSSNHMECSVSSAGAVTFNATGGSAAFAFSDPVSCTGSVVSSSGTGGVGYSTGAGGTVTQLTSKSTGVTLNKVTGTITMHNAAMTYNTKVSFVLTNSAIAASDQVIVQHESGGTVGYYFCTATPAAGSATITVYLVPFTTGSLSEAIVLRFIVIKSVNS